jgi:hypothetical protein
MAVLEDQMENWTRKADGAKWKYVVVVESSLARLNDPSLLALCLPSLLSV